MNIEHDLEKLLSSATRLDRIVKIPLKVKVDCINKYIDDLNLTDQRLDIDLIGDHNGKLAMIDAMYSKINRPHRLGSIT